jgi:hypothetical protein
VRREPSCLRSSLHFLRASYENVYNIRRGRLGFCYSDSMLILQKLEVILELSCRLGDPLLEICYAELARKAKTLKVLGYLLVHPLSCVVWWRVSRRASHGSITGGNGLLVGRAASAQQSGPPGARVRKPLHFVSRQGDLPIRQLSDDYECKGSIMFECFDCMQLIRAKCPSVPRQGDIDTHSPLCVVQLPIHFGVHSTPV